MQAHVEKAITAYVNETPLRHASAHGLLAQVRTSPALVERADGLFR